MDDSSVQIFLDRISTVSYNLPLVDAYLQAGFEALGDATRMAIFQKLANGPMAVNELAGMLPVSRPAVSQHLRVLKDAGLVNDSKAGTRRIYQLNPEGMRLLRLHFDQVWDQAMSGFQAAVARASTERTAVVSRSSQSSKKGEKHGKNSRRSRRP
jgi:DNA-binding transcriptional ArsR family regulator